jgi:hypothetical protein
MTDSAHLLHDSEHPHHESSQHHSTSDVTSDTRQKALRINLDPSLYGTFAEIGAGQEVVRWFFRVGGGRPVRVQEAPGGDACARV